MVNERKKVLNDRFGINNLIGSKEFCPVCDTFFPIVATIIPIHAREKSFNGKFGSLWRTKRKVGFCGSSHNTIINGSFGEGEILLMLQIHDWLNSINPKSVIRISLCRTAKINPNDRFCFIEC